MAIAAHLLFIVCVKPAVDLPVSKEGVLCNQLEMQTSTTLHIWAQGCTIQEDPPQGPSILHGRLLATLHLLEETRVSPFPRSSLRVNELPHS